MSNGNAFNELITRQFECDVPMRAVLTASSPHLTTRAVGGKIAKMGWALND